MRWLKRLLPKKFWNRFDIYVLSTLLILIAGDMLLVQYWRHIDIGSDTTRITTPLNAYGTPDYLAALNAQASIGVTTENNAVPLLIEATGSSRYHEVWLKNALPLLGLPVSEMPSKLVTFEDWARKQSPPIIGLDKIKIYSNEYTEEMKSKPWKSADHPLWAKWLDTQTDAIKLALRASERPRYYFPLIGINHADDNAPGHMPTALLPSLGGIRSLTDVLLCDAMQASGESDMVRFQRDIVANLKLAHLVVQDPSMIEYLVGVSIASNTYIAIDAVATQPSILSVAQCSRLINEIDTLPMLPEPDRVIDSGERWRTLDRCCYISAFGLDQLIQQMLAQHLEEYDWTDAWKRHPVWSQVLGLFYPIHYNEVMRKANGYFDRMVAAMHLPTYSQQQEAMNNIDAEIYQFESQSIASQLLQPTELVMAQSVYVVWRITEFRQSCVANHELARVALALAAYHDEKGFYPEVLKDLAGVVLKEIPSDPFTDTPLIYRRQGTGYVLYSVGPNGKDDGGIDRNTAKTYNAYDIVVRAEH